jgi:hypothetical protein
MILNFVLLIGEERNSGRYEHARACRERARAPRAPKKIHQPSNDIGPDALAGWGIEIFSGHRSWNFEMTRFKPVYCLFETRIIIQLP